MTYYRYSVLLIRSINTKFFVIGCMRIASLVLINSNICCKYKNVSYGFNILYFLFSKKVGFISKSLHFKVGSFNRGFQKH